MSQEHYISFAHALEVKIDLFSDLSIYLLDYPLMYKTPLIN